MPVTTPAARRTVLVTGASKGIGEACVRRLAGAGWHVFASVRAEADAQRLRRDPGDRVTPLRFDVTDEAAVAAAVRHIGDVHDGRLDALVNNAGIAVAGPLEYVPAWALRRQLEVNVVAQLMVTQACLPLLRRSRGRIVFLSSVSGRSALPFTGAYAASKFAIEAAADALRVELREAGIAVCLVEPGVVETPIWETSVSAALPYLDEIPAEGRAYYGRMIDALQRRFAGRMRGLPADAVARVVQRAVEAKRPRARYLLGRGARARVLAEAVLPTALRDALVDRGIRRMR